MAAQRLRQVLRHPTLDIRRRDDELRRHLGHQGRDRHLLGVRSDLERDRDVDVIPGHPQRGFVRREPDQGHPQHVLAGRDVGEFELPLPVHGHRIDETTGGGAEHDRRPRECERLGVGHRAGDREAARRLCGARSGKRDNAEQHGRQPHAPNLRNAT